MTDYKFTVVVERDEDGLYIASVPLLQGCYTQGETYEECLANIREVLELCLGFRKERGEEIPEEIGARQVTVAI